MKELIVYTDGGSRGNPGPAALGVCIKDTQGKIVSAFGEFLGIQTNNYAEYSALLIALKKALELGADKIKIRMDSELIVRQMTGVYKIKHPNLIPLAAKVASLLARFKAYSFEHISREKNHEADAEVNKSLDEYSFSRH